MSQELLELPCFSSRELHGLFLGIACARGTCLLMGAPLATPNAALLLLPQLSLKEVDFNHQRAAIASVQVFEVLPRR